MGKLYEAMESVQEGLLLMPHGEVNRGAIEGLLSWKQAHQSQCSQNQICCTPNPLLYRNSFFTFFILIKTNTSFLVAQGRNAELSLTPSLLLFLIFNLLPTLVVAWSLARDGFCWDSRVSRELRVLWMRSYRHVTPRIFVQTLSVELPHLEIEALFFFWVGVVMMWDSGNHKLGP